MKLHKYWIILNRRHLKMKSTGSKNTGDYQKSSGVFEHHQDRDKTAGDSQIRSPKPGLDHKHSRSWTVRECVHVFWQRDRLPIITRTTKKRTEVDVLVCPPEWNELQSSCITSHCRYARPRETDCMLSLWKIKFDSGTCDCVPHCCFDTRRKTGQCRKLNQVMSFEARTQSKQENSS